MEVVEGDTTVFAYDYEDAGRLVEVRTNGVVTASYVYDDNGNRLSVTRPSGTETGTYDDQDRLLSYGTATFGYTKAGELRFKAEGTDTTFYRYDALGNLLEVNLPDGTAIEYVVDGFNRRVGKKVNGVLVQGWLYQDQLNPVAELDGAGNVVSQFVYGTRANVPDYIIRNDTTYRIVADHLGSVRLVVNLIDGTVVQRIAYDEFGREVENTNPGSQPFGYAGGVTDDLTGLVELGARDYDGMAGRWMSKDPSLFANGVLGAYVYADDDPVNLVDVGGDVPLPIITGAIGALTAGIGNTIGQLFAHKGFRCFSFKELGVAVGVGFGAGAAAPLLFVEGASATAGYLGAALLGAGANVTQTFLTNAVEGRETSGSDLLWATWNRHCWRSCRWPLYQSRSRV